MNSPFSCSRSIEMQIANERSMKITVMALTAYALAHDQLAQLQRVCADIQVA